MADNDVQVTFSGDASGLKAAVGDSAASIQSLEPVIDSAGLAMKQFQKMVVAAFSKPDTDAIKAAVQSAATYGNASAGKDAIKLQIAEMQDVQRFRRQALADQVEEVQAAERAGTLSSQQAHDAILKLVNDSKDQQIHAIGDVLSTRIQADQFRRALAKAGSAQDLSLIKDENAAEISAVKALTQAMVEEDRKRDAADAQSARQMQQRWDQTITPIVRSFGQGLLQMAEGTKSFGQVMAGIGQQILTNWISQIAKSVSEWIRGEMVKTAASQTGATARSAAEEAGHLKARILSFETAEKDIFNSAAKAAAGAFNAFASNPLTLPFAPVAAAAAFSAVEAFGNIASAAGGYDIPAGVNPLTQLHQNEMVLPATIANPVRDMVRSYNTTRGAGSALGDATGDTHNHLHLNVQAMDGQSVLRTFRNNKDHFAAVFREIVRGGATIPGLTL